MTPRVRHYSKYIECFRHQKSFQHLRPLMPSAVRERHPKVMVKNCFACLNYFNITIHMLSINSKLVTIVMGTVSLYCTISGTWELNIHNMVKPFLESCNKRRRTCSSFEKQSPRSDCGCGLMKSIPVCVNL